MPPRATRRAPAPELSVLWDAVHRFRLRRHFLAPRASALATLRVLGAIGGAQAQLPSAAALSLASRIDGLTRSALAQATGPRRRIVRAWCLRRTLFWLPAGDVATFARGTQRTADREVRWARNHGISAREIDRLLSAMDRSLAQPKTRREFCHEVAADLGRPIASRRGYGWGGRRPVPAVKVGRWNLPAFYMLHLYASRRPVCFGPPRGAQATFVRADAWVPGYREVPVPEAEEALLRRYLAAYGPATSADFARWSGIGRTAAAQVWGRIAREIVAVDVEGWSAGLLRADQRPIADAAADDGTTVRLLPYFDTYLLGHEERRHLVGAPHHRRVYRPQGWIAPTVIADGRVVATWAHEVVGDTARVLVDPLVPPSAARLAAIRAEADRLARFLGVGRAEVAIGRPRGAPVPPAAEIDGLGLADR